MKTNIKDKKAFTTALNTLRKTGRELREMAQNVVLYGFDHYLEHGNVDFLNRAFVACIGEAKLDTKQMASYITAHCNVKLKTPNKPRDGFIKAGNGEASYKSPTVNWFEYEKAKGADDALKDQVKALETFIANMSKAAGEHKYKDNMQAADLVKSLKTLADKAVRANKSAHLKSVA